MSAVQAATVGYSRRRGAAGAAAWHYEQAAEEGGEVTSGVIQIPATVALIAWLVHIIRSGSRESPTAKPTDWRTVRNRVGQVIMRLVFVGAIALLGFVINAFLGEAGVRAFSDPIGSLSLMTLFQGLLWVGLMYWLVIKPAARLLFAPWWEFPEIADKAAK